jgi:glycosyltransferase involved in cell wall biosynthesis
MEAYKGVSILCDALAILDQQGHPPCIKIAGRGPELDRMTDRLNEIPNVHVNNKFVPTAALIEDIRDADCVVLPYLEASQSGVVAAALSNGRFVIASRVGGIPDVVEDMVNGLLVPPGDPDALAEAIRRVSVDPELRNRLCEGARNTASSRLNWGHIATTMLQKYA